MTDTDIVASGTVVRLLSDNGQSLTDVPARATEADDDPFSVEKA